MGARRLCFGDLEVPGLLRRLGNLRLRDIASALLFVGLTLLVFAASRGGLFGQGPSPLPSPERTPSPPTPSPTNPPIPTAEPTRTPHVIEPTAERPEPAPPPTRLVIPILGVDAPVVELPITDNTWDMSGLTYEIAHLGGTAKPGERNNMVLAGHVTLRRGAGPFLHLERLEPGNTAIVYAGDEVYTYRVVGKSYIAPTDVSIVQPTSDPILTLLTCTNWDAQTRLYHERVAVIAELVEDQIPSGPR